jgi:hypothetical protein
VATTSNLFWDDTGVVIEGRASLAGIDSLEFDDPGMRQWLLIV